MTQWSICIAERPLALGPFDSMAFKEKASHSFLRVKDHENKTVLEIHGMAFDPKTNAISALPKSLRSYFSAAAYCSTGHQSPYAPRLRVICFDNPKDMYQDLPNRPVHEHPPFLQGNMNGILKSVEAALRAGDAINNADIAYYPFDLKMNGQNCHSVTAELIDRMTGIQAGHENMVYAAPGIKNDLEQAIPELSTIMPKLHEGISHIKDSVINTLQKLTGQAHSGLWDSVYGASKINKTHSQFTMVEKPHWLS